MPYLKTAITQPRQPPTQKFGLDQALTQPHKLEALELAVLGDTTLPSTIFTQTGGLSASSATAALPHHFYWRTYRLPHQPPQGSKADKTFSEI